MHPGYCEVASARASVVPASVQAETFSRPTAMCDAGCACVGQSIAISAVINKCSHKLQSCIAGLFPKSEVGSGNAGKGPGYSQTPGSQGLRSENSRGSVLFATLLLSVLHVRVDAVGAHSRVQARVGAQRSEGTNASCFKGLCNAPELGARVDPHAARRLGYSSPTPLCGSPTPVPCVSPGRRGCILSSFRHLIRSPRGRRPAPSTSRGSQIDSRPHTRHATPVSKFGRSRRH
ncbi:hypothetical protein C8Q74DRAFT_385508 [Fomes fomentarius]|nr:hypothetical protein C8Q74DRAFT_385508 [Fomes fomentarius]